VEKAIINALIELNKQGKQLVIITTTKLKDKIPIEILARAIVFIEDE
jgi:hypothetical protein